MTSSPDFKVTMLFLMPNNGKMVQDRAIVTMVDQLIESLSTSTIFKDLE